MSPRLPDRGLSRCLAVVLLLISSYPLRAHDPPTEYYGRNITVEIDPGLIRVTYRLEISQVTLYNLPQQDKQIQLQGVKDKKTYAAACLKRFEVLIPDRLLGFVNDKALKWSISRTSRTEDKGSIEYHIFLRADYAPKAGANRFEITDTNFVERTVDAFKLKVDPGNDITFTEINEPREGPRKALDEARQTATATFHIEAAFFARINLQIALRLLHAMMTRDESYAIVPPIVPEEPAEANKAQPSPSIWELLRREDLAGLLTTSYGFWFLILIALIHGAGHSLMPGHGKTMVAAYLVGERGTPWHAILLGIVTTLTHTSAAIIIAIVVRFTTAKAESINSLLLFVGGLMMAGIGLWLFLQRIAGRSDHVHLFDMGHAHSHGESVAPPRHVGTLRLILLGIAGGIIPCWGAILWVIGCIATSQFWLALPIVLAFSIGLSSVLIALGLSVVYSGRIGSSRWGERAWFKQTIRWLPVIGATVVIIIGLVMCATSGITGQR
jgi:nickel/cobalt transporter (NicO) family protein